MSDDEIRAVEPQYFSGFGGACLGTSSSLSVPPPFPKTILQRGSYFSPREEQKHLKEAGAFGLDPF